MTEKPRTTGPGSTGPGSGAAEQEQGRAGERVVIRDKRRIDQSGGKSRPTGPAASADPAGQVEPDRSAEPAGAADPAEGGPATPDGSAGPVDAAASTESAGPDGARDATSAAPEEAGTAHAAEVTDVPDDRADATAEGGPPAEAENTEEVVAAEEATSVDEPAEPAVGASQPLGAELEAVRAELDERTRDLQRVSAEYANYRKRVDRDRGVVADQATGAVLAALLPVLDDLDRAREHGDLVGPFGSVAEQLTAALGKFGLTAFGAKGDPFDPNRHEAVAHLTSAEVTEPTCVDVMRRGYLLGERLLRAALVAVADPE